MQSHVILDNTRIDVGLLMRADNSLLLDMDVQKLSWFSHALA